MTTSQSAAPDRQLERPVAVSRSTGPTSSAAQVSSYPGSGIWTLKVSSSAMCRLADALTSDESIPPESSEPSGTSLSSCAATARSISTSASRVASASPNSARGSIEKVWKRCVRVRTAPSAPSSHSTISPGASARMPRWMVSGAGTQRTAAKSAIAWRSDREIDVRERVVAH